MATRTVLWEVLQHILEKNKHNIYIFCRKNLKEVDGPPVFVESTSFDRLGYCHIIRKKDIDRFVKARRISLIGHVERMEDSRMPKRVMREKRGRPKVRWLDDVQEDLREMGIEGWRRKAQDRDQWR